MWRDSRHVNIALLITSVPHSNVTYYCLFLLYSYHVDSFSALPLFPDLQLLLVAVPSRSNRCATSKAASRNSSRNVRNAVWFMASRSTNHLTGYRTVISNQVPVSNKVVQAGNSEEMQGVWHWVCEDGKQWCYLMSGMCMSLDSLWTWCRLCSLKIVF